MFYNGNEWVEYPLVSADDEGFVSGYSVYEVIRTYYGIPYRLRSHYDRLKKNPLILWGGLTFHHLKR